MTDDSALLGGLIGIGLGVLISCAFSWLYYRREMRRVTDELHETVRGYEKPRQWPNVEHPIVTRAREKANEQLRQKVGPEEAERIIAACKQLRDSVPERKP